MEVYGKVIKLQVQETHAKYAIHPMIRNFVIVYCDQSEPQYFLV